MQPQNKKGLRLIGALLRFLIPGGDLRSRAVSSAVSSALRGLTSVFGMGTGVTLAVIPPRNLLDPDGVKRRRNEFLGLISS
jgi:hypothetical protein